MKRSLTFAQFEQIIPHLGFKQEGSDYIGPCPICGSPRQYYRGFEQGEGVVVSIPMGNSRSTCRCSQNDIEQVWLTDHFSKTSSSHNGSGISSNGTTGKLHEPTTAIHLTRSMPIPLATLLAKDFPPLVWLVPRFIAQGQLVLLGGRPKGGKSWLVLQLVQCVDTGQSFLGKETKVAKALYIALEDGARRVYQRCQLLKWQPRQAAVLFHIARFDGPDGRAGPGLAQIDRLAASFNLIVIDTLIGTLSGGINENDNTRMGLIINELARIAHNTDTAVVLVHHTGKSNSDDIFNTLRGASAIRGGYDVGLLLDRKPDESEAILHAESRDVDVENMTLRQSTGGAGWEYVGSSFEIEKIRAGRQTLQAMLEMDQDDVGLTVKEISSFRSVSEATTYKQLERLEEGGYVFRNEQPSTQMGKKADIWYVAPKYR